MRKRYTEEQIIAILNESRAGAKTGDLVRRHGISRQTFYRWRRKYGEMQATRRSGCGSSKRRTVG